MDTLPPKSRTGLYNDTSPFNEHGGLLISNGTLGRVPVVPCAWGMVWKVDDPRESHSDSSTSSLTPRGYRSTWTSDGGVSRCRESRDTVRSSGKSLWKPVTRQSRRSVGRGHGVGIAKGGLWESFLPGDGHVPPGPRRTLGVYPSFTMVEWG